MQDRARTFTPTLVVLAWVALAIAPDGSFAAGGSFHGQPERPPNLIQIVLDDATPEMLSPQTTPAIWAALVRNGASFTDAIATTPACCPARAALATGQYAHNNGVDANLPGYERLVGKRNLLERWLRRAGYETTHIGKVMRGMPQAWPERTPPGWDRWHATRSHRYDKTKWRLGARKWHPGAKPRNFITRIINRKARRAAARATQPFFLSVAHLAPHLAIPPEGERCSGWARSTGPLNVPFESVAPVRRPSFDRDNSDRANVIQGWSHISAERERLLTRAYRCAVASLAAVDRGLRKLMRALRRRRVLNNTAIVVLSDNGMMYGEHRVGPAKQAPYYEALHVPLVLRLPAWLRADEALEVDAPVALIDVAPTLLQLAEARPCVGRGERCRRLDGRELVASAQGASEDWHDTRALGIEIGSAEWICAYSGVRTPAGTLVRWSEVVARREVASPANPCEPGSFTELYDRADDPFELDNLARPGESDPYRESRSPGLERELDRTHRQIRTCTGIEGRDVPPPAGLGYCD